MDFGLYPVDVGFSGHKSLSVGLSLALWQHRFLGSWHDRYRAIQAEVGRKVSYIYSVLAVKCNRQNRIPRNENLITKVCF